MNDAAAAMLGVLSGSLFLQPPGGLAAGLKERAARGIVRRGNVLTWARSAGAVEPAWSAGPAGTGDGVSPLATDLTGWECADSSFHLEDAVPVDNPTVDGVPALSEAHQRVLLLHGLAFALEFSRLVYALDPPTPVRCILGANETNATFRFHQIRPGESWNAPDLDGYRSEKMVVIDIEPTPLHRWAGPYDVAGRPGSSASVTCAVASGPVQLAVHDWGPRAPSTLSAVLAFAVGRVTA
ncbi:MAG TPA: hypothetical protein VE465_27505 [Streptosporangiaceae bacterium]|jgi:hypothetical protein|nr:hypothetical protein [Streptosporangiaceae bacterium]